MVGTLVPAAPKLTAPAFGDWLREKRGSQSLEQLAIRVRKKVQDMGLKVPRSAIERYEKGRIPPWPVLYAFSELFEESPTAVAARLFTAIQLGNGRDLLRHNAEGRSGSHQEVTDVPASDLELSRLRKDLDTERTRADRYAVRLREAEDVASRLLKIVALGSKEERAAARATARRGRRDRTTG